MNNVAQRMFKVYREAADRRVATFSPNGHYNGTRSISYGENLVLGILCNNDLGEAREYASKLREQGVDVPHGESDLEQFIETFKSKIS